MKLKIPHAPYIGNKIALDLSSCGFVSILHGLDGVSKVAQVLLVKDLEEELKIEEKAREIIEENLDEIEFMQADEHQLFWKVKKHIAQENDFNLAWEDRYNALSHKILNELIDEDLIDFAVSETRVKNVIFKAIDSYVKAYSEIEEIISEKISNYKRKIVFGSEEYELIFDKLYQEELKKRGFL
ncbi:DUF507 family protein [Helicobacter burdigaliensis]|uniref:DUF507 family protein n=1 Tax=Helicobacter burdigaliensis TaxID=2315334 RepID=UPI000EF70CCC|nr:DUF507 family protein [Helicobacter burdigaliensis]